MTINELISAIEKDNNLKLFVLDDNNRCLPIQLKVTPKFIVYGIAFNSTYNEWELIGCEHVCQRHCSGKFSYLLSKISFDHKEFKEIELREYKKRAKEEYKENIKRIKEGKHANLY